MSIRQRLILCAVFGIVLTSTASFAGASALETENRKSEALKQRDVQAIVDSFDARRMRAIEEIIKAAPPPAGEYLTDQIKALAILYYADRTKDHSRVKEANDLLLDFCHRLDKPEWWARTNHAGALIAMRILLTYEGRKDLLFPETVAKMRDGKEPDGCVIPEQSLRRFIPRTCYDPGIHIGIHTWKQPFAGATGYTENHRLQYTLHALLLCQVYRNESYPLTDGPSVPMYSSLPGVESYWGYWKRAFYDYLIGYRKPRMTIEPWQFEEFRHMDWGITEKDSATYTHVYLGDFWMLRDSVDDPIMAKYCEMFIDLVLADYAEEKVGGVFAGAHENSEKHTVRLPGLLHIYNYLLFDDLPYVPSAQDYFYWGAWGYASLLTSDYNPTNPRFPKVIIDVAVNKPAEGYMVTEAIAQTGDGLPDKPKATWIKPDYALGFALKSWDGWGYHAGGAYVATPGDSLGKTGLAVLPFGLDDNNRFDLKYSLICPMYSVVGPGVAITQNGQAQLPSKIWIKEGFKEDFSSHPPWMFFTAKSVLNRSVYLAIRPVISGYHVDTPRTAGMVIFKYLGVKGENIPELADSAIPHDVGTVIKFDDPSDYLVWEISDSSRYASFEAFQKAIVANELKVTPRSITYTSSEGIQLKFHRDEDDFTQHSINGKTINYDDYRYVIKNPWMEWPQNKKQAHFERDGFSASYNFDPAGDGVFIDRMPEKTVKQ